MERPEIVVVPELPPVCPNCNFSHHESIWIWLRGKWHCVNCDYTLQEKDKSPDIIE